MTPEKFTSMGIAEGDPVQVTFGLEDGKTRTVRLFFRGFRYRRGRSLARSVEDIVPAFSPPNRTGGMQRRYYTACDTSFRNIVDILPLKSVRHGDL